MTPTSILGIFTDIWLNLMVNVGKYTYHTWIVWDWNIWDKVPCNPRIRGKDRFFRDAAFYQIGPSYGFHASASAAAY